MATRDYSYMTRKQAGIVYAAVKRGELRAAKKTIGRMYDLVGATELDTASRVERGHFERCVGHIIDGRMELAQAELDGRTTRRERVLVGTTVRIATEDDWFYEVGEEIEENVYEERWVVA